MKMVIMMIIIDNEDGDYDEYEDENDVYNDSADDDAGDDGLMLETQSHSNITLTLLFSSLIYT